MVLTNNIRHFDDPVARARAPAKVIFHRTTLISLLMIDALLVAIHAVLGALFVAGASDAFPDILRIDRDWSLGEIANYLKWIALIGMCIALFTRQNAVIFLAVAIMCAVALFDDSLQLHERFSAPFSGLVDPAGRLPAGTGELTFLAMEGMLVAVPLLYGWIHAPRSVHRQIIPLLGLFFAAFVCAGVVDFLHVKAAPQSVLSGMLGMLEDGGEMVFLSLMVSYTAGLLDKAAPKAFVADPA